MNIYTFYVQYLGIFEMKKIQNQKMQIEFNDHVENDISNLDII